MAVSNAHSMVESVPPSICELTLTDIGQRGVHEGERLAAVWVASLHEAALSTVTVLDGIVRDPAGTVSVTV